ncbi:MAG: MotA/TolQ/ExbB proton channel family protein [Xanthomonadales bacterium]|nr:MotA/TolQ/ExbB proton channel family protein [Xanthomonadales bacterium]
MIRRLLTAGGALLVWSATLAAQDEQATNQSIQAPTAQPAPQGRSIEEAYQREFAFLEAQRRELESLIAETRQRNDAARASLQRQVDQLQREVVRLDADADRVQQQVNQSEEQAIVNADNREVLAATFQQGGATLDQYGVETLGTDEFAALDDAAKVTRLFREGSALSRQLGSIRREQGIFYTGEGREVAGEILKIGNIAAYGRGGEVTAALAPAGGGRLKVWPQGDADAVSAVLAGGGDPVIPIFLFETLTREVETRKDKGVIDVINDGGTIGWVVVMLGLVGLVLCVMRVFFLKRASTSVNKLAGKAGSLVAQGKRKEALVYCKKKKSAPARVVAAAIRNLDKDREHLEDIVSEAILHESPHLNRFGVFILVVAAVAPLLGLLGTVTGMISTFEIITEFGTGDPKLLSGGIAIALVTTELGLIVAIPMLLLGNLLSSWAETIKDDMEKGALYVINLYQEKKSHLKAAA